MSEFLHAVRPSVQVDRIFCGCRNLLDHLKRDITKSRAEDMIRTAEIILNAAKSLNNYAACDVCNERIGERTIMAGGTETWICDKCGVK